MRARDEVVAAVEAAIAKPAADARPIEMPWGFPCIDGRELARLSGWIPRSEWHRIGIEPVKGMEPVAHEPDPWTRESIVDQLRRDVAFGFEKALGKRGISAELMWTVVSMWLWVLEHPLFEDRDYPQYGLPLFKAVALAFGFPNPIGEARGDEFRFSADWREE